MRDLMRVAKLLPEFMEAVEIFLYEINQNFIKKQKNNLAFIKQKIHWINNINKLPPIPCIIISNEFFDALPIKQFVKTQGRWHESSLIIDPIYGKIKYSNVARPVNPFPFDV